MFFFPLFERFPPLRVIILDLQGRRQATGYGLNLEIGNDRWRVIRVWLGHSLSPPFGNKGTVHKTMSQLMDDSGVKSFLKTPY